MISEKECSLSNKKQGKIKNIIKQNLINKIFKKKIQNCKIRPIKK